MGFDLNFKVVYSASSDEAPIKKAMQPTFRTAGQEYAEIPSDYG